MTRILNIKSQLCSTRLIKTLSGKHINHYEFCSIFLVGFTMMLSSLVLMPSEVYSDAEDRKQFHGELRESARNELPTNYWSFHDYVEGADLFVNISGINPVSNPSKIFVPSPMVMNYSFVIQHTFFQRVNISE